MKLNLLLALLAASLPSFALAQNALEPIDMKETRDVPAEVSQRLIVSPQGLIKIIDPRSQEELFRYQLPTKKVRLPFKEITPVNYGGRSPESYVGFLLKDSAGKSFKYSVIGLRSVHKRSFKWIVTGSGLAIPLVAHASVWFDSNRNYSLGEPVISLATEFYEASPDLALVAFRELEEGGYTLAIFDTQTAEQIGTMHEIPLSRCGGTVVITTRSYKDGYFPFWAEGASSHDLGRGRFRYCTDGESFKFDLAGKRFETIRRWFDQYEK